jgi:hypothetical protein
MAIVRFGSSVHSLKGRVGGSVFSRHRNGSRLVSNNWSKAGHTWRAYQNRAQQAAISSNWRALTPAERTTWYAAKSYDGAPNNYVNPTDVVSTTNPFNLFSTLNSKLKNAYKFHKNKPPTADIIYGMYAREGAGIVGFVDDMSYVVFGPFAPLEPYDFTYWGGPFTPLWKTVDAKKNVMIINYYDPGGTLNKDVSGEWQSVFGPLPTDPGYVMLGGIYTIYTLDLQVQIQTTLKLEPIPVNGAPPYVSP